LTLFIFILSILSVLVRPFHARLKAHVFASWDSRS